MKTASTIVNIFGFIATMILYAYYGYIAGWAITAIGCIITILFGVIATSLLSKGHKVAAGILFAIFVSKVGGILTCFIPNDQL